MASDETLSTRELADAESGQARTGRFDREADDAAPATGDGGGGHDLALERDGDAAPVTSDGDGRNDPALARDGDVAPVDSTGDTQTSAVTAEGSDESPELFAREDNAEFQRRWEAIQTGFVDEPRQTVEQADELVAQVMQRLAQGFAAERERLEQQWGRGEDVSTEDLRIALQRYRGFFQRLLSA
jgi:hypothetical protein